MHHLRPPVRLGQKGASLSSLCSFSCLPSARAPSPSAPAQPNPPRPTARQVLHVDRNGFYGAESTSLHLEQLYERFRDGKEPPKELGRTRDWAVDLTPKFIMACGNLVKILMHTKVTRYLDFKLVAGSYVFREGKVSKVPATAAEALSSPLMGFFQKRKFKNFLEYVQNLEADDQSTWKGFDVRNSTARQLLDWWKLDDDTVTFTGHAMALYTSDEYLSGPCLDMCDRIKLYAYSVSRYGSSPFIYPMWGLSGLPEGFSRLAAVHGGTYMLNKPVDEVLYNEDGTVRGIRCGDEEARCGKLLGDPTYFKGTDKARAIGHVATSICILSHPIDGTNADSAQIILPARSVPGRHHDLYVVCLSHHHNVAGKDKFIAVVSGRVEDGSDPHDQLIPALRLLGRIDEEFFFTRELYAPAGDDGSKDNVFVSNSYDETSHFESATADVMSLYKRMTGEDVDLTAKAEELGQDE